MSPLHNALLDMAEFLWQKLFSRSSYSFKIVFQKLSICRILSNSFLRTSEWIKWECLIMYLYIGDVPDYYKSV